MRSISRPPWEFRSSRFGVGSGRRGGVRSALQADRPRWGCRLPSMGGLLLVAVFVWAGATAANPYVAIVFLSLGLAFQQFTEGAYWSGATFVAGPHKAAATGILNTGG